MSHPDSERIGFTEAHELAAMIRGKEISPVEVTEVFLERIEEINPRLNAYVTVAADAARQQAREAEEKIMKGGETGTLHGVPAAIKDLALTKGIRSTSGSRVHEARIPDRDNYVVERLRRAGVVILGKTNTPEFGWLSITDNELFGPTNNPWALSHTSGGSSGGAGAAAAAGLAPVSSGSDGGGSVRHPASFCGVFGIKPTFGVVPRLGFEDGWATLSHQGPLARSVAGAAIALDAMAGYESRDFCSAPLPPQHFFKQLNAGEPRRWRVAWSRDLGFAEVDPRVVERFEDGIRAFEALGCEIREACPDLRAVRKLFQGIMFPELVGCEYRFVAEDGSSRMNPELTKFVTKRKDILARDYLAAEEARREIYASVEDFFGSVDLLLTPTMAIPPFEHPKSMSEYPHTVNGKEVGTTGWHPFTPGFNLTHHPAASIPCGFTQDGLPVGMQIVGPRFADLRVMQAAAAFEQTRPWAQFRPKLSPWPAGRP